MLYLCQVLYGGLKGGLQNSKGTPPLKRGWGGGSPPTSRMCGTFIGPFRGLGPHTQNFQNFPKFNYPLTCRTLLQKKFFPKIRIKGLIPEACPKNFSRNFGNRKTATYEYIMTIIFNNKSIDLSQVIEQFKYLSYRDNVKDGFYKKDAKHRAKRETWIRSIVVHTNRGMTGPLITETPAPKKVLGKAVALAKYQATSTRVAGWDYTVDFDGTVACSNDPFEYYTYHAGTVNRHSVGIEMCQQTEKPNGTYKATIDSTVLLLDVLTFFLGIQRQVVCYEGCEDPNPTAWLEKPIPGRLQHLSEVAGGTAHRKKKGDSTGADVCGIYGHRNVTKNKGAGDPGNHIFDALEAAGYEVFNSAENEDLTTWKLRQQNKLGFSSSSSSLVDGIAGPATRQAIFDKGISETGLWVPRPIDVELLKIANCNIKNNQKLFQIPFS